MENPIELAHELLNFDCTCIYIYIYKTWQEFIFISVSLIYVSASFNWAFQRICLYKLGKVMPYLAFGVLEICVRFTIRLALFTKFLSHKWGPQNSNTLKRWSVIIFRSKWNNHISGLYREILFQKGGSREIGLCFRRYLIYEQRYLKALDNKYFTKKEGFNES